VCKRLILYNENVQGGSDMTGTICVNKSQFVPVIFEPPFITEVYLAAFVFCY
jgi:hypothetical protein